MEQKNNKFYITTPIYYVNDVPHIGHAYTSVLTDVLARYNRFLGKDVLFLTGTDEHGAKICRSAEAKGVDVKDFVDENSAKFKELFKLLNISNDDFIRTSDQERHWPNAQKIWGKIRVKEDVYKKKYEGLYCVGCEAFITERDLVDGKCIYHDKEPEKIEEENYFFKLSKYGDELKNLIEKDEFKIYPESKKKEVLSFIGEGLRDISISRPAKDIKWGIPVPWDSDHTLYVWAEALVNYLSALDYKGGGKLYKKFWPADIHIMAKDILRFHAVVWPAILLSAGLELPKSLLAHGFINSGGKKMSKTLGNVVDPTDIASRYGVDALRYYLVRELTPFEDGDFTEEKFKETYNANLANGLGNYVSRVFKMAFTYFEGSIKKPDDVLLSQISIKEDGKETYSVPYVFDKVLWPKYQKNMKEMKINKAADVAWEAISILDGYVQDYEPFRLIKTDKEKTEAVLWSLLCGLANIVWMIYPFMPETAEKIMAGLGVKNHKDSWEEFKLNEVENLFPRKE